MKLLFIFLFTAAVTGLQAQQITGHVHKLYIIPVAGITGIEGNLLRLKM